MLASIYLVNSLLDEVIVVRHYEVEQQYPVGVQPFWVGNFFFKGQGEKYECPENVCT